MAKILTRLETGAGRKEDMDTLKDICDSIFGRSFCALGDGATSPIVSALKFFRDEFERHVEEGGCPFGASRSLQGSAAPLHGMDEEAEQASPSSSRQGAQ
jgi:NADH-quinone oxidoreductase subunit F